MQLALFPGRAIPPSTLNVPMLGVLLSGFSPGPCYAPLRSSDGFVTADLEKKPSKMALVTMLRLPTPKHTLPPCLPKPWRRRVVLVLDPQLTATNRSYPHHKKNLSWDTAPNQVPGEKFSRAIASSHSESSRVNPSKFDYKRPGVGHLAFLTPRRKFWLHPV